MIRSDEYISIFLAVMIVFTPIHTVNGQNELAYLETNMVRNDPNTNTFRVIQEQTAAMAFEWKQMTHKSFGYVYLVHDVYFWGDNTVKVYGGNIGLLEAVGKPCDVTKYRAEGYTNAFFPSNFRTYQMTYKRVPRIENVEIQLMPNLYPHVSWERETSACESTDSTIIFRGFSRQHLRMFIFPSDQAEYYANDFEPGEGMEEVFILFNEHENLFSLPTMGNIFHVSYALKGFFSRHVCGSSKMCTCLSVDNLKSNIFQDIRVRPNLIP
uniref:Pur_ac_phosph_N domain-containing protein n=1 Tax=Schistosoma mansoni TaxID=6183 RepID=A0A5K4FDS8_SCHMA